MQTSEPLMKMEINKIRLFVRLGCTPEERTFAQEVNVNVNIKFPSLPQACNNDKLDDTICYAKIASLFDEITRHKEYALVEKLGFDLYNALMAILPKNIGVQLHVTKVKPPVSLIDGGVRISIESPS